MTKTLNFTSDEFRVLIVKNTHSTRLELTGTYLMVVGEQDVKLKSAGGCLSSRFHVQLSDIEKSIVMKQNKNLLLIDTKRFE